MQLISFSVSNFKSIKDEATISFVADERDPSHFRSLNECEPFGHTLPSIALFGANGSGKSNLLSALIYLKNKYDRIDSHAIYKPERKMFGGRYSPEAIPSDYWTDIPVFTDNNGPNTEEPTTFRLSFLAGVVFDYAISISKGVILEEILWRRESPEAEPQILFHREGLRLNDLSFTCDDEIPKRENDLNLNKPIIINSVMPSLLMGRLFYYPCADICNYLGYYLLDYGDVLYNHEWVSKIVVKQNALIRHTNTPQKLSAEENLKNMVMLFNYFGCPITGLVFPKVAGKKREIQFVYKNRTVSMSNESTGNKKLMGIVFMLLRSINNGGTLVFDEVESGFHEILAYKLIELVKTLNEYIHQRNEELEKNRKHGVSDYRRRLRRSRNQVQLLFTTHNTKLLDPDLMRKDQIWFSTKNDNGESEYYSLSSFSDVGIVEDFQREYLKGDFRAIPTSEVNVDMIVQALRDSKILF